MNTSDDKRVIEIPQVPASTVKEPKPPKGRIKMDKVPRKTNIQIQSPQAQDINIESPQYAEQNIPAPPVGLTQNQVIIDGVLLQIKSTKLKYHRAKVTDFYRIIRQAPLSEILSLDADFFGDKSPDKMLFDWLVAVIDDPDFVTQHYNNITSEDVDKLLKIFCRLNGYDEREERKNRQAQVATTNH